MKSLVIIQARMGSTRLPQKVLQPFHGEESILDILLNKLKASGLGIVVATSVATADAAIADRCEHHGVECYRGPENDVLARFIGAAKGKEVGQVVRICADNPFLQVHRIAELLVAAEGRDYASFAMGDGTPVIVNHIGLYPEVVSMKALGRADREAMLPIYREHVTNYIHSRPEYFDVSLLELPDHFDAPYSLRFTLDTAEDMELLKRLYPSYLRSGENIEEWVGQVVMNDPQAIEKMSEQIEQNSK